MSTEAAVAEAPAEHHADPAETPVGDIFNAALAKARQSEQNPATEPTAPQKATPEADAAVETAPEKKQPASALEAALTAEAPADEKPEGDDPLKDLPETLPSEGRKDHWKNARNTIQTLSTKHAEAQRTIADLQAKVAAGTDDPETKGLIEKLQAENNDLRDTITAVNIELEPEFRKEFIDGRKALVDKAAAKTNAYGGNAEALVEALSLPEGRRRNEAIRAAMGEDIDDVGKGRILSIIAEIEAKDEKAAEIRANSQQSFERLTEKQQASRQREAEEIATRRASVFEKVGKKLGSEVATLRTLDPSIPGAEEWNTAVKSAFEKAPSLFENGVNPEELAAVAVKGLDYDRITGLVVTLNSELTAAKKQLAEFDGAQPDVRARGGAVKTGKDALLDKDPGQIFAETLAAQRSDD